MQEDQPPQLIDRETWQLAMAKQHGISEGEPYSNVIEPLSLLNVDNKQLAYAGLQHILRDPQDDSTTQLADRVNSITRQATKQTHNPFLDISDEASHSYVDLKDRVLDDPDVQAFIATRDSSLKQAHNELIRTWPYFLKTFESGVKSGIDKGYIPEEVGKRLDSTLSSTATRVAEGVLLRYADGSYTEESNEVRLAHTVVVAPDSLVGLLTHEFTHQLSGGSFLSDQEGTDNTRSRTGYSSKNQTKGYKRNRFNEAVAEHLALGILDGDFETLDPDKRPDDNKIYYAYRKVLADFFAKSEGILDVKTLTNGFYEDSASKGGLEARKKFIGEVTKAYEYGALLKLEELCSATDFMNDKQIEKDVLPYLHGSELDEQGSVVKVGYIDLEGFNEQFTKQHPFLVTPQA